MDAHPIFEGRDVEKAARDEILGKPEDVGHLLLPVRVLHRLDLGAELGNALDAVQRVLVEPLENGREAGLREQILEGIAQDSIHLAY